MDVMELRRRIIAGIPHTIDTEPVILAVGKAWINGNLVGTSGTNATIKYSYPASTEGRQLRYENLNIQINVFNGDTFVDYWSVRPADNRNILNANTNKIAFSMTDDQLATGQAYAYIPSTGQILFAGKNTPYYGYTNINDMPAQG